MRQTAGIILALDVPSLQEAVGLVKATSPHIHAYKVGLELVHAAMTGRPFDSLREAGAPAIFYDAKLHDIPNTVAGALRAMTPHRLWMVNVHAAGGRRMVRAAAEAVRQNFEQTGHRTLLVAVTLLTSLSAEELQSELQSPCSPEAYVLSLARLAQDAGADGVVASPHEIEAVRRACGPDFVIVTPGIRPFGASTHDQRRTMSPAEAVRRGADYLVVGRAITGAGDPAAAAAEIAREAAAAHAEGD
jgi:orotidine-5'-phosphate decarboxylase